MGRRALLAALPLALVSCGSGDLYLGPPPELTDGGSVVFVVLQEGEATTAVAVSADARPLLALTLERSGPTQVVALQYAEPLAALGLEEGDLSLVAPERCGAVRIPTQDNLHRVVLEDGRLSGWEPLGERPAAVEALRLAGPCPCMAFPVADKTVLERSAVAVVEDGQGRLLMVTRGGALWSVTPDAAIEQLLPDSALPSGGLRAIHLGTDGEVWVGVDEGVLHGPFGGPFTETATTIDDELRSLAGGPGPDGYEVFGATEGGRLVQLAPGTPRTLARRLGGGTLPTAQEGRIIWEGPGRVVATEHGTWDIFWMEDGVEVARQNFPINGQGALRIKEIPGMGLVALSPVGAVMVVTRSAVQTLPAPDLGSSNGLSAFPEGLIYGSETGFLEQYRVDFGFCPAQTLPGQPRILGLYPMGDRVLAVVVAAQSGKMELLSLAPEPLDPG